MIKRIIYSITAEVKPNVYAKDLENSEQIELKILK